MLRIFIDPERVPITNWESGITGKVYRLFLYHGRQLVDLYWCGNFSDVSGVVLIAVRGRKFFKVDIPPLEDGVVEYLNTYHGANDISFDCYAFVNLVYGVLPHGAGKMEDFWVPRAKRKRPSLGEVAFLFSEDGKTFLHAAIHVGWGRYMSVYGKGGTLMVSSLRDMKIHFGAPKVCFARPKENNRP